MLLNRRGFATAVFCRQCAGTLECPNCSVSLTVHRRGAAGARAATTATTRSRVPTACPHVRRPVPRADRLRHRARRGRGPRRCSRTRASRASIATRSAARARSRALLARFARRRDRRARRHADDRQGARLSARDAGRRDSADVGLGLADFRAAERTFQLLTQVAGRAGRGEHRRRGDRPDALSRPLQHPLACRQDYPRSTSDEMHVPPRDALSAGGRADQRRRQGAHVRRRDGRCRRDRADALRTPGREPVACSGPRPRRSARLQGRVPRAVVHQGDATATRCARRCSSRRSSGAPGARSAATIVDVDPLSVLADGLSRSRWQLASARSAPA